MGPIIDFDKMITTEPDNGYDKWCDEVWKIVTREYSDDITAEDVNNYWDNFFEPLTLRLSVGGTLPSGGCNPDFAASAIRMRWRDLKTRFPFLLPILIKK